MVSVCLPRESRLSCNWCGARLATLWVVNHPARDVGSHLGHSDMKRGPVFWTPLHLCPGPPDAN